MAESFGKLNYAISQLVNELKEKKHIGNRALSLIVGISNPHISRKLNNLYSWDLDEIEKIAEYFGYKDSYSFISKSKKYYGPVKGDDAEEPEVNPVAEEPAEPRPTAMVSGEALRAFERNEKGEITVGSLYGLAARKGDPCQKEFLSEQEEPV